MSMIRLLITCACAMVSLQLFAEPPVEVIGSCKNNMAIRPSVTFTKLEMPRTADANETGCVDLFLNSVNNLSYGGIYCNDNGYLILNDQRIKLSDAKNYSVNPAIKPGMKGERLDLWSVWSQIDFANTTYLCIASSASTSGSGAAASQYYIVENPLSNSPALYYYFYAKDLIPLSDYTD